MGLHSWSGRRPGVGQQRHLLSTEGSEHASDFLTVVTPRAALGFRGRWINFQLNYIGSYQLYQQLSELNAFDQRLNTAYRQVLSRRLAIVSRNSLSRSPSTDAVDIPGVLFRRQGVTMDDYRGGLEARLSKHTTLSSLYTFRVAEVRQRWRPLAGHRAGARRPCTWRHREAGARARPAMDGRQRVRAAARDRPERTGLRRADGRRHGGLAP